MRLYWKKKFISFIAPLSCKFLQILSGASKDLSKPISQFCISIGLHYHSYAIPIFFFSMFQKRPDWTDTRAFRRFAMPITNFV